MQWTIKLIRRIKFSAMLAAIFLMSGTVCAGDITEENERNAWKDYFSNFIVNGYIENESAYRLHSPQQFSKVQNLLQLEVKGEVMDYVDFYVMTWVMYDAAYDIYPDDYPDKVRDEYQSNFTADEAIDQIFREVYFDVLLDSMDIRLGKQQVVWGEAIGLRITDVVNPQDYREFILDDFIDSRIPLWMGKINYYLNDWTFEGLWIPFFEPNRFALAGSEWEWTFNRFDPPGGMQVIVHDPDEPTTGLENGEFGGRAYGLIGGWNISTSYLYAWDDSPARHARFDPSTFTLNFDQRYHRMHVVGFTFANAFGRFVPRGEFSYNLGKYFSTADQTDTDGLKEKDFLYYMIGTDYSLSDFFFNTQFIQKIIMDYEEGIYEDQVQNNLSLWVQGKFINETLKPELLTIYGSNDGSWLIRPKVAYDFTDHVVVTAGIDILEGSPRSFFGQFDTNDRIYVEFKYSF